MIEKSTNLQANPHTVTVIWQDGFERSYEHDTARAAGDFVHNGISWSNPGIRFARIYGDNGEPVALESADSVAGALK